MTQQRHQWEERTCRIQLLTDFWASLFLFIKPIHIQTRPWGFAMGWCAICWCEHKLHFYFSQKQNRTPQKTVTDKLINKTCNFKPLLYWLFLHTGRTLIFSLQSLQHSYVFCIFFLFSWTKKSIKYKVESNVIT